MYKNISKARSQLMGIAMIMIMIFHTSIKYPKALDLMKNFGDFGVNIFFLISGYSMCYAWNKSRSMKVFYRKRFTRILLTYLPIAIVWCSISVLLHECGVLEAICKILTIQFWIDGNLLHWFVSGILLLYLITPVWLKGYEKNRRISLVVTICICCIGVALSFMNCLDISIFVYRLPAYFMGLYMGIKSYHDQEPDKKEKIAVHVMGLLGILCFAMIRFDTLNYTWKYMIYLLLSPAVVVWLAKFFGQNNRENSILSFCSLITLETYLVHEKILRIGTMLLNALDIQFDSYLIVINIVSIFVTIVVAYLYNRIVSKIINCIR